MIEEEIRGSVALYARGSRYVIHSGCPIKWEIAPMIEAIRYDGRLVKIRRTLMPRIPGDGE